MDTANIAQMTRHELLECINNRKNEIAEKLKKGETEPKFAIGAEAYTCKEWDNLIKKVDKNLEAVKEEQEERKKALEKKQKEGLWLTSILEPETTRKNYFMEKINGTYKGPSVPYEYLAHDGVISYNGVIFTCNEEWHAICLGNMSDRKNVLTIPLSEGGSLMVHRDNFGDLTAAISMFSPEDANLIMRAIADDKKAQKTLNEIEEDKNSIGDDAEENVLEDTADEAKMLNQLIADNPKQPEKRGGV